jgi:hypothetical protein
MPEDTVTESPAKAKLRATAEALKAASEANKFQELATTNKELVEIFQSNANVGTKQVSSEDLEVPSLRLIQKTSDLEIAGGEAVKLGYLYRSDSMIQRKEMLVNILCFKKVWADNFNRTAEERKHIYYGAFEGSSDIFRMYLRGWSLTGSRKFLSEVKRMQNKFKLPMYALQVRLSSKEEHGVIKETSQAYTTFGMVMTVVKNAEGMPLVEEDPGRATWLKEMALNFESLNSSDEETETPEPRSIPVKPVEPEPAPTEPETEHVEPSDIPF